MLETLSRLLRCRYAGDLAEREAKARLEIALRERGLLQWPQDALVAMSELYDLLEYDMQAPTGESCSTASGSTGTRTSPQPASSGACSSFKTAR